MKITRRQLSQIIKEEIDQPSEELDEYAGAAIAATSAMKMLSPIISELQEALGLIDDLFDKYFNHDGEPNEDSMLDDKSRKV